MLSRFEELMHVLKAIQKWGLNYRDLITQYILPYTRMYHFCLSQFLKLVIWIPASADSTGFAFGSDFLFLSALTISLLPTSLLLLFFPSLLHMTLFPMSWSSRSTVNFSLVPLSGNRIPSLSSKVLLNLHTGLSLVLTLSPLPRGLGKFDCVYPLL